MRIPLRFLILVFAFPVPLFAAPLPKPMPPERPTQATVEAWEAIGAKFCWKDAFHHEYDLGTEPKIGWLLRIEFRRNVVFQEIPLEQISRLPEPPSYFGLWLENKTLTEQQFLKLPTFHNLRVLVIEKVEITPKALGDLKRHTSLGKLIFHNCTLSSEHAIALGELTSLTELRLNGLTEGHDILKELAALRKLRVLHVDQSDKNIHEGMKCVAGLPNLEELQLWGVPITAESAKTLAGSTTLRDLSLKGYPVGDDVLKELAGIRKLDWLSVTSANITDEGAKHLAACKTLKQMFLSETKLTDEGMRAIGTMKQLECLSVADSKITDEGLKPLEGLDCLYRLNIEKTAISDEGMKTVAKFRKLRYLNADYLKITDACFDSIAALDKLEKLSLHKTNITQQAVDDFQLRFPKLIIWYST